MKLRSLLITGVVILSVIFVSGCPDPTVPEPPAENLPEAVASPAFSPDPGLLWKDTDITISCTDPDAVIYFTKDGSEPGVNSEKYTGAIKLADNGAVIDLKAVAVKSGAVSDASAGSYCLRYPYHKRISYASGPDCEYFTSDDEISYYRHYGHTSDGVTYMWANRTEGMDGIWMTEDDIPDSYSVYEFTDDGRWKERRSYIPPGPDGEWMTPDDELADNYITWEYRDGGRTAVERSYHAGPDGVIQTPDDVCSFYGYEFDELGNYTLFWCIEKGVDGLYLTADDGIDYRLIYERDAFGVLARQIDYFDAGGDEIWGTADDEVGSYHSYRLADDGSREYCTYYSSSGPDGNWFTSDDEVGGRYDYVFGLNEYKLYGN